MPLDLALGIDFGTSGARAIAINADRQIVAQTRQSFAAHGSQSLAVLWQKTLFQLIQKLPNPVRRRIAKIAVNGTSATVLLCTASGAPITEPLLYNDDRGAEGLDWLRSIAPADHAVVSATSSLAKLRWWATRWPHPEMPLWTMVLPDRAYFLHQADWLAFLLHGQMGISDYHNALKLGYDLEALRYPDWMQSAAIEPFQLPTVVVPGTPIAPVQPAIATQLDLPPDTWICAGTTDSIAAFLASGVQPPGEAVTSLGSTIVLKLLSQTRVDQAQYGIYSHRLDDRWLVGGASNSGGAVLRQFFSDAELQQLSYQIQVDRESPLDYYPLLRSGERFPINNPNLQPRLQPRPENPAEFLHGLLEGMARIEAEGYRRLQQLGATPLTRVHTAGGGAQNLAWQQIRKRQLSVPVLPAPQTDAAFGTALLALQGI